MIIFFFFFSSRRRHTRLQGDWSSDVCSSDLEADALCEDLAIIDHGRIIAQGTPKQLKASIPGGYLLRLRFDRAPEELLGQLRALPGVTEVRTSDHVAVDVYAGQGGPLIGPIVQAAQSAGSQLNDVHI